MQEGAGGKESDLNKSSGRVNSRIEKSANCFCFSVHRVLPLSLRWMVGGGREEGGREGAWG